MKNKMIQEKIIKESDEDILYVLDKIQSPWKNIILKKNIELYLVVIETIDLITNNKKTEIIFTNEDFKKADEFFQNQLVLFKKNLGIDEVII